MIFPIFTFGHIEAFVYISYPDDLQKPGSVKIRRLVYFKPAFLGPLFAPEMWSDYIDFC
jgi:hypothetical protein